MRKRNKLYTANKWNQPLFAQDDNTGQQNMFALGGDTWNYENPIVAQSLVARPRYDFSYLNNVNPSTLAAQGTNDFGSYFAGNIDRSSLTNTTIKNPTTTTDTGSGMSSTMRGILGAASSLGTIGASEKYKRGLYDIADPLYHLAGGKESAVGNGLSNAGVGLFQAGAQSGNGLLMLAGGIAKGAGSLTNALFGTKWNSKNISTIENNTNSINNATASLTATNSSNDLLHASTLGGSGYSFSRDTIGKKGIWAGHKLDRKYRGLQKEQQSALAKYDHALNTSAQRIDTNTDEMAFNNTAAFGGPLEGYNTGAIDYGFMSDYLTTKNKAAESKGNMGGNIFGSLQAQPFGLFALGGDMQTNSSDFTTGLTHIDEGGSHEENPYQGVQVGVSRNNGKPNLVEEGETIFEDYVFSQRIKIDRETKKRFHLSRNADMTYADLSKKLEKESVERPNDAISQEGLKMQLRALAEEQERQKAEMQAKEEEKMREEFEKLPPEQQQEIMQQMAMQEQQAQQAQQEQQAEQQQAEQQAMQEQQMQGQQQEPQEMTDEQMIQQQPQEAQMEGQQLNAYGGMVNRFDVGGNTRDAIYKSLGLYTDSQFNEWAKKHNLDPNINWEKAKDNEPLWLSLGTKGAALRNAISRGYDFGAYTSPNVMYDWKAFSDTLDAYHKSKEKGNADGNYQIDDEFPLGKYKTIQELQNSPEYKAYTQYMMGVIDRTKGIGFSTPKGTLYENLVWDDPDRTFSKEDYNALQALKRHSEGTSTNPDGENVPLWEEKDLDDGGTHYVLNQNADTLFERYRTDDKGGIFHLTPKDIKRNKSVTNLIINDDGTVEEIRGDVPKDLQLDNSYSWQTPKNDEQVFYYRAPGKNGKKKDGTPNDGRIVAPVHKNTWGRIAGMLGPAVGLTMQAMGLGKPNLDNIDRILKYQGMSDYARSHAIGTMLHYQPMDVWAEQNRADANSRATARAITNSSTPFSSKQAALVVNDLNNQIAGANIDRQALEYNNNLREKEATFNRGTEQFDAESYNTTSRTNAEINNANRKFWAQMGIDAARQRMDADASWYKGIYGNVSKLFSNLSDWGKENAQHNMIADMAADGIFGPMSDRQYSGRGFIRMIDDPNKNKSAKGGKLNRKKGKRGLTF